MNKIATLMRRILFLLLAAGFVGVAIPATIVSAATDDWTTSLHDISRTGASADTSFATTQAALLAKRWSVTTGGAIASQPAIVNGVVYVGSWDGYEYALSASTGTQLWRTYLGITNGHADCNPTTAGVSSAATVQNGVVYVGGGDSYWYALDATTGNVLWRVFTGDNSADSGHYNWSSPLLYAGYAYIGVSSLGDCPLVQGELLKVDLSTHQIVNTLKLVPDGQVGAGIWTSPAYDPATNKIYATTGTEQLNSQTYAQAVLAIDANTMAVVDSWHLPESEAVADSDWTTSTALYTDANNRQLVLATNKNGYTYAFLRSNLAGGPVWQQRVAIGNECAACGNSTVSSAALGGGLVYQAGGTTIINGVGYGGSVQGWNRTTGAVVWQHPTAGPIIGALTYMNGMVIDGAGSAVEVLDASNGHRLYSYDTGPGNLIFAASAVGEGTIVTGNTSGKIVALGLGSAINPPTDTNCPSGFTCQDIGNPTPTGSETVTNGTWNVSAGGAGATGTSDAFRLMSQTSSGDTQITARVTGQQSVSANAQAGLMLRQSNDPASPYYAVFLTPNGVKVQYRNTFGGTTTVANTASGNAPLYLEIQRINDTLQAATSSDGTTYTLIPGSTATVVMPFASLAGLAVSSGINGTAGTATFANVNISSPNNSPQNTPPATACPTSWSCGDIGDPLTVGNQSLSGNTWTVSGAGNGVDGRFDQLHYVWQSVAGDATTTTHITNQTNTAETAKTGLMMRASTSANAAYYGAFVTPTSGIKIQFRSTQGLPITSTASAPGAAPLYLRIARSGNTFTTYTSPDGAAWSPVVGSTRTIDNLGGTILSGLAVTSVNASGVSTATADMLSTTSSAPTPPTVCPNAWTCADIGPPPIPAGSQYLVNGTWSILAGGKDIWNDEDEFHYVAQTLAGDGSATAHIASQGNTDPWAKAGVMIRDNLSATSAYYGIFVTPGNGTVIQYRTTDGGQTSQIGGVTATAPEHLKVTRTGNTFAAYTSTDGINWTPFPGSSITLSISTTAYVGMASTSHSQFVTNTVNFDEFSINPNSSLPSPWEDNDVGSPSPAGSSSYTSGTFTVKGGGNDIWSANGDTIDQFHYVSQPLAGDGSIVARVTTQDNTSDWAKSGVMIKQSTTSGSSYALLAITPTNGITFQHDFNTSVSGGTYTFPNAWLKLARTGNTITAYKSADGTTWTQLGSTTLALNNPATIGLFVTSHNAGALNTSTFDNVTVTASASGLPSPWTDSGDIDGATPAGSSTYANSTFTINGGGNDIWGTADRNLDQFHYVSRVLSGDGTITARVTSQTNTSDWAKAGVMIKQSTVAGSTYALLGVTPTNGLTFQYNFTNSIGGGTYTFPNAWLRLTRIGNVVTAYKSPDGTNWTQIGNTTLVLTDPVTVGLFVTSHNAGALSAATFDNVSVTTP